MKTWVSTLGFLLNIEHTRRFFKGKQVYLNLFLIIRTKVNPVQYAKQKKFERQISVGSARQFHLLDVL